MTVKEITRDIWKRVLDRALDKLVSWGLIGLLAFVVIVWGWIRGWIWNEQRIPVVLLLLLGLALLVAVVGWVLAARALRKEREPPVDTDQRKVLSLLAIAHDQTLQITKISKLLGLTPPHTLNALNALEARKFAYVQYRAEGHEATLLSGGLKYAIDNNLVPRQ